MRRSTPLDRQTIDTICVHLCQKMGYSVSQDTASGEVFGVMSAYADMIAHSSFHLGFHDLGDDTWYIAIPFEEIPELEEFPRMTIIES